MLDIFWNFLCQFGPLIILGIGILTFAICFWPLGCALLASAQIAFVVMVVTGLLLWGFGGLGKGGGKGDREGAGNVVREATTQTKAEQPPSSPVVGKNELLITIEGNTFVVDERVISIEEIYALLEKKIAEGGVDKVVLYYKLGYKAKVSVQSRELMKKFSGKINFDSKYEREASVRVKHEA